MSYLNRNSNIPLNRLAQPARLQSGWSGDVSDLLPQFNVPDFTKVLASFKRGKAGEQTFHNVKTRLEAIQAAAKRRQKRGGFFGKLKGLKLKHIGTGRWEEKLKKLKARDIAEGALAAIPGGWVTKIAQALISAERKKGEMEDYKGDLEQAAEYAQGTDIGKQIQKQADDINPEEDAWAEGLKSIGFSIGADLFSKGLNVATDKAGSFLGKSEFLSDVGEYFEKGIDKIQDINPLKEGRFTQFLENTKTGDYVKKLTAPGTVSRGLIDRQIVTEGFGIKDLGYDTQFDPVGFDPQTEARKRYNPYR